MKGSDLVNLLQESEKRDVFFELRDQIESGTLMPNEKLNENEIRKQCKCGQGELRDALQRLEEIGLVKLIPFSGSYVSSVSYEEIKELFEYRRLIELNALHQFLLYSTNRDIEVLQKTIEVMVRAAEERDFKKLLLYDMYFHRYIVNQSKRTVSLRLWSRMVPHIKRYLTQVHPKAFANNYVDIATSHIPLLEAMKSGDAELAKELFKGHIAVDYIIEKIPMKKKK